MVPLLALALAVTAPLSRPAAADPRLARMAALYGEVCLRDFPDDDVLDAAVTAKGARRLTEAEARITLVDDPGRGWALDDTGRTVLVFLELPPFHACSVRFPIASDQPGIEPYQAVIAPFLAANPGFEPIGPYDTDRGDIHIRAIGAGRRLPDGRTETLLLYDQSITDPARRAKGETGVMRRFVHQIVTPH